MLDERKAAVLRAVVEHYIESAQPVGSAHVAREPALSVSSATVRNDMHVLEREGYLTQPHTSAGRIPTDLGYRYFVDNLASQDPLDPTQMRTVAEFFDQAHGQLDELMTHTAALLTRMTDYAAVVVPPEARSAVLRAVQLVSLSSTHGLVVAVLSDGRVDRLGVDLAPGDESLVDEANRVLAETCVDRTPATLGRPVGSDPASVLAARVIDTVRSEASHDTAEPVAHIGGVSRMASAFDAVDTVRRVLGALEEQFLVVTLLRDLVDQGLSVSIGAEHGVTPLAQCSVVVAPVDGGRGGTIAVVGPTRMHYSQALATLAVVGERLSEHVPSSGSTGSQGGGHGG